jgi:hypothetical protein
MAKWMRVWAMLMLSLMLALAACGSVAEAPEEEVAQQEEAAAEPTEAPEPEPTETPEPEPTETPEPEPTAEPTPTEEDDAAEDDDAAAEDDDAAAEDDDAATEDDDAATEDDDAATEDDDAAEDDGQAFGGGETGGDTVINEGGYAFTVPEGWLVVFNTAIEDGNIVLLIPDTADPSAPPAETVIAVNVGPLDAVFSDVELPADPTAEDLLNTFTEQVAEEDIEVSEVQSIEIGEFDGSAVDISGTLPDTDVNGQGQVAVALLEEERVIAIFGAATPDIWDPAAMETIYSSFELVDPAEAGDSGTEEETAEEAAPEDDASDEAASGTGSLGELDADGQVTENTFPLPEDATNVQAVFSGAGGSINYETSLSPEEVADFYRETLTPDGAVEREILTQITDGILNLVFDNWAYSDGRAVVIQTVPLGPDTLNVNVRFEDI